MFEIIRSLTESDRVTNFVAIGNLLNEEGSFHSAFIVKNNNVLFEFHYTGRTIELTALEHDYFHKITDTIHPDEVPSFLAYCQNIIKKANPKYGFFYSGQSYDIEGNHLSENDLGERMTCVGFCLNVLKGFLEEEYIQYTDWSSDSHEEGYLERYCEKHHIDITSVKSSHRRITPIEVLISGFYTDLPIRKILIDKKQAEVKELLKARTTS